MNNKRALSEHSLSFSSDQNSGLIVLMRATAISAMLALSGCGSTSEVSTLGPELYTVTADSHLDGIATTRGAALKRAHFYCDNKRQQINVLDVSDVSSLGNSATTVKFSCYG